MESIIYIFLSSSMLLSCQNHSVQERIADAISYEMQVAIVDSPAIYSNTQTVNPLERDTLSEYMHHIQSKIYDAFVQSMVAKNNGALEAVQSKLIKINTAQKTNLGTYWIAYADFYNAVFYSEMGNKGKSEQAIEHGIDLMNDLENKNAEDYALLSYIQAFSLQFKGMKAAFFVSKVNENAETALEIDSANLRANFVYASNDFYTPEKYGGGTKAEQYLLKAISLPDQNIENDLLPSWGKAESYEMLIRLYINRRDYANAKLWFSKANEQYPDNYRISVLASKLVGK